MLSILCVSDMKDRALPFIEDMRRLSERLGCEFVLARDGVDVQSKGYLESVLEDAIALTHGEYVLRLDDDERCSPAMVRWLEKKQYLAGPHWSFPRVHFWRDPTTVLVEDYYFPDIQTRLSKRQFAGGRNEIHAGSPHGAGMIARVCIEHWVYLVKSYQERCETRDRYLAIKQGADGGAYRSSSIEDDLAGKDVRFLEYNDGTVPMRGRMYKGRL